MVQTALNQVVVSPLHGGAEDGQGKRAWRRLIRPLVSRESTGTFQLLSFSPGSFFPGKETAYKTFHFPLFFILLPTVYTGGFKNDSNLTILIGNKNIILTTAPL